MVHVSWDDALAYAQVGRQAAARPRPSGSSPPGAASKAKKYAWGDEFQPGGKPLANTWQGHFPETNTGDDGFPRTRPVEVVPAQRLRPLRHDRQRLGVVRRLVPARRLSLGPGPGVAVNPTGPGPSFDPDEPYQPKRVTRGGSFLCSPNYCSNYRPAPAAGRPPTPACRTSGSAAC